MQKRGNHLGVGVFFIQTFHQFINKLEIIFDVQHGYSGHGVTGSHTFGRILSEAINGDLTRFDTFAALPWYPFPGGRTFRVPYSVIGSWWYELRDRLGV